MRNILLVLCLSVFACKKDYSCNDAFTADAVVSYTGPVEGDGCHWNIVTSTNQRFYPDNLPDAFKEEQLAVHITYTLAADSFYCGIAGTGMPKIHLESITK